MVWPFAKGTSLVPIRDLTPPFFYFPLKSVKDSILFDADVFNEFKDNPDLYFDSI